MPIIAHIAITAAIALTSAVAVYDLVPLSWFENISPRLGSTITTIAGTDTLSSSRSTINTNFSNLNTDKFELSAWYATTSAAQLTTLANLATVGTITSGVWNGTTVTVARGGTGSTTLSSNQVLLGNGTTMVKTVDGFGTSGQFLTSNGVSTAPSWQSSSVNQADNFTWTGNHLWSAAASSTRFAALDTVYVGRTATSTVQGSTTGTSTLQGFLDVSGTNSTSTFSGNLAVTGNATTSYLRVSNRCIGCARFGSYATSSTFTINVTSGDQTETVNLGYRMKQFVGTATLDGNTDNAVYCLFRSYEDDESWIGGLNDPTFDLKETGYICRVDGTNDDMRISISAITDTSFTLTYDWIAGSFLSSGVSIEGTIIGE